MTKGNPKKSTKNPQRLMTKTKERAARSTESQPNASLLAAEAADQGVVARFEAFESNPPAAIEIRQAKTLSELTLGTIFGTRTSK